MRVAVLKKPQRKHHAWPWVLLSLYLLSWTAPIVAAYVIFHDPDTKKVQLQQDFSLKNMGQRIVTDSLDKTVSDENITMSITENDMDNILDMSLNKAGFKNEIVKKSYMKINDDVYCFYIDFDAVLLKTRLRIITNFSESSDKKSFLFKINDVAIGRLGGLIQLSKGTAQKYLNEQIVSSFFEKAGISMSFDKDNFQLVYKKSDVIHDLNKMNGVGTMGLYYNIIETLIERDEAAFSHDNDKFITVDFDLKKLKENDLSKGAAEHLKVAPEDVTKRCKDNLVKLVNNKVLDPQVDNLTLMFSYLFAGYNSLSEANQEIVKSKDFSSVGISDVTAYKGFNLLSSNNYLREHMDSNLMDLDALESGAKEITLLTEDDLNTFIAGRNIFGFTSILQRYDENGKYKLNYITVDNFYANIYENTEGIEVAEFVCKVNINGYHTSLSFTTNAAVSDKQDEISFSVLKEDGIQYGEVAAPELDEQFFSLMADTLNTGDTSISADKENHSITMHFGDIIDDAKKALKLSVEAKYSGNPVAIAAAEAAIDETFTTENVEIKIVGNSRNDDGGLNLYLKENKYVMP